MVRTGVVRLWYWDKEKERLVGGQTSLKVLINNWSKNHLIFSISMECLQSRNIIHYNRWHVLSIVN